MVVIMTMLKENISGSVDIVDLVTAGTVKYFGERALTGIIGNGTVMSGGIKLGSAIAIRSLIPNGRIKDAISLGLAIDGMEDILFNVLGGSIGSTNNNNEGW
jgi:hypothetical protein